MECRSEFLLANVCLSLTNEGHWYGVIWLDSHSSCLLLSNRTGRENPGTHRPHLFYIYRGILELKPSKALPFWHSIILNFTPQKEKKKTLHTFLSWDKVGQELLAAIPFILWLGTLSTMAVISAQGVHDLKTLPRVTGWETERQAIIGPWHQWRRLNQNVQKGSRVGMSGGVYECFFFFASPVALLVDAPPSSWGLHASICLCRCSASVECTAFPWIPSPEPPPRLSPSASGPAPLPPPRFLPPWPASPPRLGLLWSSARGGTISRTEGRWDISGSSSSGIGLYQISPSSSASFSSAGSTLRGWGDTLVWLMFTWIKTATEVEH